MSISTPWQVCQSGSFTTKDKRLRRIDRRSAYVCIIDLELTIDPAPPGGIFGTMIFLYLMVCSIHKIMIATFCWGFKELRYQLNIAIFCIFNTKTSMYQVI